jgi:ELWxxDGT repeat protein
MGSEPIVVGSSDALILFYATTLTAGRELWCTNAVSEQQTSMVSDLYAGVHSSLPMAPTVLPDAQGAYVVAYADAVRGVMLFRYYYATNAIRTLVDVEDGAGAMTKLGNRLIFANSDSVHGWELWHYEEDTGEFGLLLDLEPGTESAGPSQFFTWGNRVLFQASTEETGKELWITDGTAAGTQLLSDINPGPHDSDPYGFVAAGDHVFFRAKDDTCGQELWVTDGTTSGTQRVIDLMTGSGSGDPYNLVAGGQGLFFSADDGATGEELWWTRLVDGEWKAEQVADLYPGPESSEPTGLQFTTGGRGYFLARSPSEGRTVFTFFPNAPHGDMMVRPVKMRLEKP